MSERPSPDGRRAAEARIAAAQQGKPGWFRGYLRYHPRFPEILEAIACRDCGAMISGLVEDERFEDHRTINGRLVIFKRLVFARFANYGECTLECDDGSAHVTHGCRDCLAALTAADLEAWYAADLAEMADLERRGGGPVAWRVMGAKRPVRVARGD